MGHLCNKKMLIIDGQFVLPYVSWKSHLNWLPDIHFCTCHGWVYKYWWYIHVILSKNVGKI